MSDHAGAKSREAKAKPEDAETIMAPAPDRTTAEAARDAISSSGTQPAPSTRSGRTPLESSRASTVATTVVMRSEEVERARAFYRLTAIMVIVAAAFMPIVPGPRPIRALAMAICFVAVGADVYALRLLRDEQRYTARFVTFMGVLLGLTGELALFYFGLFTAAVMVLPLGVYFFGLAESRKAARVTFCTGALLYGLLSLGVVLKLLPDLGPMPIGALATPWKCFFVVMVQVVFATTYFLASSSRRATETAIARVDRANRQIWQKEALLAEARIELDRALRPGEGRYTGQAVDGWMLGELLGRGGMGEVYRAERQAKDATVELAAIKLLHPIILSEPAAVKRFEREAELAQRVTSPHVARVRGRGVGPSGLPYVSMELLVGHDLAWHLRQTQRLRLSAVVELVDHAAKALVAIREAGIVHRDLKPQNLMLVEGKGRSWKLLDFGVSRLESSGQTLTQGALIGTPAYMAPEQAKLQGVDHRADVYSLAAVAYRALTGKPAFVGDDVATVLYHVVHTAPAAPSAVVRLPEDVELALAVGLAKSPDARFQKAEDFATALRAAEKSELDEATRARARKLLAATPWSQPSGASS
ncbi:MAG TPA: serine/threonine-protein kinase [Polyangiaceae bacterium]|nr:serine/threonine-protein kinase [Polyangiaceae bacterium]